MTLNTELRKAVKTFVNDVVREARSQGATDTEITEAVTVALEVQ